jgi:tripartite-type tricarboxylate transporter receptor subunit TctC
MLSRRCFVTASMCGGLASFLGNGAQAATIAGNARLIVGFPPGGSLDVVARLLAEHMRGYAASIIVENRAGAGGRIALEGLKSAEPDGSVMVMTPGDQITLFPHVYQRLSYDPLRDFAPVAAVCTFPYVLAIGPMVPNAVTTLAQFVEWCRANPRLATFGSPGAGTRPHFLGVILARDAAFDFVHAPYRGGAAAMQDVLGGRIPAIITVAANALPQAQSGNLRILATTAPQRSGLLPAVPTVREAGYPGMEAVEWFGILLPRRTPGGIVTALHDAVQVALRSDAVRAALARQAFDVAGLTAADLLDLIKADTDRWSRIVKNSGFRPIE